MKIYKLSNYNSKKDISLSISRSYSDIHFDRLFKKVSGGEDYVEISSEAIARLNQESAITEEKLELMKTAANLFNKYKELNDLKKTKPSNFRIYRIAAVKDSIDNGSLNFENDELISDTADIILREKN